MTLSLFLALNAGILKIPGNKFKPKGYIIDNAKLNNVSFINIICVFIYTAQKQDIKYKKNNINKLLNNMKIINLIIKYFSMLFDFLKALLIFFSCFIVKISDSDKDKIFKIIFIAAEITEE